MPRATDTFVRSTAAALAATAIIAGLTGCHTSSGTTLGLRPNHIVQDRYAVTDSIGAAMFAEHVRLAHAEAYERHLRRTEFATVPLTE
jgi:hypothetical protein